MRRVESAEIVAAAREWLGTPWRHQGRLKGVAMDCGGVIIRIGRELGLLDFDTRAYGRIPDSQQLRALCEQHLAPRPISEVAPGDVLLMRFTPPPAASRDRRRPRRAVLADPRLRRGRRLRRAWR